MAIYFSTNTNIADVSGALQFQTANITRLNISTTGTIASSSQPAFHAQAGKTIYATGQPQGVGLPVSTGLVTYTSELFDTGNNLNISNGRFTAPVTGVYFFRYHQLVTTAGEYRFSLFKNGAVYAGLRFIDYKTTGNFQSIRVEGHVSMTVNDYVTIGYELGPSGATTWADAGYGSFTGHLVG